MSASPHAFPDAASDAAERGYSRGVYLALAVVAAVPLFGLLAGLVELGVAILLVRSSGVPVFTVTVGAMGVAGLLFQGALLLLVVRRPVDPARLQAGSWVVPVALAVSSVIAVAGNMGLRLVATSLLTAAGDISAFARHAQIAAALNAFFALGGAVVVAAALLLAFARWRGAGAR